MRTTQQTGQEGEDFIVHNVDCPNCGKKLMRLPKNYPLYDIQCTGCSFRAQVKTRNAKPTSVLFGAGWDILHKTMKSGYMVPPLIVNFHWYAEAEHREIRFYPFVPKKNLKKHLLSQAHRQAGFAMFNYVGLDKLPHFKLFESPSK